MKKNALVLGAGLIGGSIAVDLARDGDVGVSIADISDASLARTQRLFMRVGTGSDVEMNCFDDEAAMRKLIHVHDVIVSAVPDKHGLSVMQAILEEPAASVEGKSVVDIAFGDYDPFRKLGRQAKLANASVAVDCGLAPGLSNMLPGKASTMLSHVDSFCIEVGGLPVHPEGPHFYKAPFAPESVIDEYTRDAWYRENGALKYADPLDEIVEVTIPTAGTFEAFRSDGLHTLLRTMRHVRNMSEWTLRHPKHLQLMKDMRDAGKFSHLAREQTLAELRGPWELGDHPDRSIMRVTVEGWNGETPMRHSWLLKDEKTDGIHSMARTTGSTAARVARLMLDGKLNQRGVIVPEWIGANKQWMDYMMKSMEERGVRFGYSVGPAEDIPRNRKPPAKSQQRSASATEQTTTTSAAGH